MNMMGFNIGGRNLPLGDIQAWMRDLSDLKQTELVLYCHSGIRSGMAAEFMRATGFSKARNLIGGVVEWQERADS